MKIPALLITLLVASDAFAPQPSFGVNRGKAFMLVCARDPLYNLYSLSVEISMPRSAMLLYHTIILVD